MQLVVKAPERAFDGAGVVVLKEGMRDAEVGELRLLVGFNEEAARVAMDNRPSSNTPGIDVSICCINPDARWLTSLQHDAESEVL